jgi:hypothetical protein
MASSSMAEVVRLPLIASMRRRVAVLSLHLLQICLVYINTLMVQQVLATEQWKGKLTIPDYRGLSPLFYTHVNPYGTFRLDMNERLRLEA